MDKERCKPGGHHNLDSPVYKNGCSKYDDCFECPLKECTWQVDDKYRKKGEQ